MIVAAELSHQIEKGTDRDNRGQTIADQHQRTGDAEESAQEKHHHRHGDAGYRAREKANAKAFHPNGRFDSSEFMALGARGNRAYSRNRTGFVYLTNE